MPRQKSYLIKLYEHKYNFTHEISIYTLYRTKHDLFYSSGIFKDPIIRYMILNNYISVARQYEYKIGDDLFKELLRMQQSFREEHNTFIEQKDQTYKKECSERKKYRKLLPLTKRYNVCHDIQSVIVSFM